MNRLILVLTFNFTALGLATTQEQFLVANGKYVAGEFAGALQAYQSLIQPGPAVWYNIGNCHYQLGDHLAAYCHWQRALQGATSDLKSKIQHNLSLAVSQLNLPVEELNWRQQIEHLIHAIPLGLLQGLGLLVLLLLSVLAVIFYQQRRFYFLGLIFVFYVLVLTVTYLKYQHDTQGYAITKTNTTLQLGPGSDYPMAIDCPAGSTVRLTGLQNAVWRQVVWKAGVTGWLAEDVLFRC